jgi:hypothetical protein
MLIHDKSGPTITVAGTRDALLMEAYVRAKCGAELNERELRAMSEYAENRKAAAAWLASIGMRVIPARLKWEEQP